LSSKGVKFEISIYIFYFFFHYCLLSFVLSYTVLTLYRDILKPLGRYLKIKDTQVSQPDPNPLLEENYQKYKKLSHKKIHELSKKLELSERDIERWVRRKTQSQKSTKLHKFSECCWKGLCYTICFSYGIYALWNEPYLWNLQLCAINYPHHVRFSPNIIIEFILIF
jgi:sphingoid base N-palmitoyltransferase